MERSVEMSEKTHEEMIIEKLTNMVKWLSTIDVIKNNRSLIEQLSTFTVNKEKIPLFKKWVHEQLKHRIGNPNALVDGILIEYGLFPFSVSAEDKTKFGRYLECFCKLVRH